MRKNVMSSDKTVMLSGYAPAPRGTSFQNLYGSLGVIMIVDIETDVVIDAEFTFITSLANGFFSEFMQGIDLKTNIDELADSIRRRCWAPSTEALVACVKIAIKRYFDTKIKRVGSV